MLENTLLEILPCAEANAALAVERAKDLLTPFLNKNTHSDIETQEEDGKKYTVIKEPWGDESLAFILPEKEDELQKIAQMLNSVYLPERYMGIWHCDTNDLEIIYTAHPIEAEVQARRFEFYHQSHKYVCEFGRASDRLLTIADIFEPVAATDSDYRNLWSFGIYNRHQRALSQGEAPIAMVKEPICFWIRGIESWNEVSVLDLVTHLNFYMKYFDTSSPFINVLSPETKTPVSLPQLRYRTGEFPTVIYSRDLNKVMLGFWADLRSGDPAKKFISSYRIIEYASFFHIEEKARKEIRKTLLAPDALSKIDPLIDRIINCIPDSKDSQKVEGIIRKAVDPSTIWKEISQNMPIFSRPTEFEGGVVIAALVNTNATVDSLDLGKIAGALKNIRNALAHGRDQRTSGVIMPTPDNFRLLRPWTILATVIASEVIIYRELP